MTGKISELDSYESSDRIIIRNPVFPIIKLNIDIFFNFVFSFSRNTRNDYNSYGGGMGGMGGMGMPGMGAGIPGYHPIPYIH
jgi:hypothetical protein